jgi:hypothetical protein
VFVLLVGVATIVWGLGSKVNVTSNIATAPCAKLKMPVAR